MFFNSAQSMIKLEPCFQLNGRSGVVTTQQSYNQVPTIKNYQLQPVPNYQLLQIPQNNNQIVYLNSIVKAPVNTAKQMNQMGQLYIRQPAQAYNNQVIQMVVQSPPIQPINIGLNANTMILKPTGIQPTAVQSNNITIQKLPRIKKETKAMVSKSQNTHNNKLPHFPSATPIDFNDVIFVNPKQYKRILIRREQRLKLEDQGKITNTRPKYIYESRHRHAQNRLRGKDGRFY